MTTVRVTMVAFPLRVTMVAFPLRVTMVAFAVRVTMVAFPLRVTMVAFAVRVTMVAFSPTLGRPPDPVGFSTANATTTITHADRLLSQDLVPLVARRQLSTVDPRRVHMKNLDGGASCTTAMQCTTMQ